MMEARNREKTLILLSLICLGALAGDKLILTPLLNLWDSRSQQIEKLEESLNKGKLLLTRERELNRRWREMQRDSLPADASLAENQVLKSVDNWVREGQVQLISFRPQWIEHEEQYRTFESRAQ